MAANEFSGRMQHSAPEVTVALEKCRNGHARCVDFLAPSWRFPVRMSSGQMGLGCIMNPPFENVVLEALYSPLKWSG